MIYIPGDEVKVSTAKIDKVALLRKGNKQYATVVGVVEGNGFLPLEIAYRPKLGDTIVGVVEDMKSVGYFIDSNTGYTMIALRRELSIDLNIGDIITAKIGRIEEDGTVILSNIRVLRKGILMNVPPSKVPRIIGKEASMVKLIREKTKSTIQVGSNGYVYINGGDTVKAINALKTIVARSHLKGLTDEIKELLG